MMRALVLSLLSAGSLAGCADPPPMEHTISAAARAEAAPELVPLGPLLAESRRASRAGAAQSALADRAAALSSTRIADPGTEGLAERGRLLRARAARLRAQPL